MHRVRRIASTASLLCVLSAATFAQSTADQTGLTALIDRLGAANVPTGAGVEVGQVEANGGGGWAPDLAHPEFAGKTFVMQSSNPGVSGHATTVGQYWYGLSTSIAPGISTIDCWSATHWLAGGFLNGAGATPPDHVTVKIFNHSWIGPGSNIQLRKLDFAVGDQELVVCDGVNNGAAPLDVVLLSHAYNALAVGRSDGQHHFGDTRFGVDGPGRMKPEMVAPASFTSFSTPLVAGGAALLVETARTHPILALDPDAQRADVLRAVLMAGAEHRAGWTNNPIASGPQRGRTSTPLDIVYGADELDVDHSHWILTGAQQPPATVAGAAPLVAHAGWALADMGAAESRWWRFHVESRKSTVSVLAAWNRQVAQDFAGWSIPDVDLELWLVDPNGAPTTLVGDPGLPYFASGDVESASLDDNVEHLFVRDLEPGDYLLELRRPADALGAWKVAVAWELACTAPVQYGTGKTNSIGLVPELSAHGFANVSADSFELRVKDGVPLKTGVVFWGTAPANLPFMGGTLLVQPPIVRLAPVTLDAAGAVAIPLPLDAAMVGSARYFQFWYRDPNHPDGFGIGLTSAVEVRFCY